jgi:hypothetical protein
MKTKVDLGKSVKGKVGSAYDSVYNSVSSSVYDSVESSMWGSVYSSVFRLVWDSVNDSINIRLWKQRLEWENLLRIEGKRDDKINKLGIKWERYF